ncbi:MAG: hypothetical protein JOZ18_09370 [Chloroflexi bacterium]|nr:hypothetical protein [Chloroflexota bacterium]
MKIILSRKGFDSSTGKVASPIFPSCELCSLPIPEARPNSGAKRYEEIKIGELSLGMIVRDLTRGKIQGDAPAHLDPDLNMGSVARLANWKPVFGQAGAAERHLQNHGVKEGDVFIFYGWFRQVEQLAGVYRYVKHAPDLHVIFGWLQIERRIPVEKRCEIPLWALDHPHCRRPTYSPSDSVYIATDYLKLPGMHIDKPGGGVFRRFHPDLCLTAPGASSRSTWRFPGWFSPGEGKAGLSYHANPGRWTQEGEYVLLKSVGRGQEFVLDCEEYPESIRWLSSILELSEM